MRWMYGRSMMGGLPRLTCVFLAEEEDEAADASALMLAAPRGVLDWDSCARTGVASLLGCATAACAIGCSVMIVRSALCAALPFSLVLTIAEKLESPFFDTTSGSQNTKSGSSTWPTNFCSTSPYLYTSESGALYVIAFSAICFTSFTNSSGDV